MKVISLFILLIFDVIFLVWLIRSFIEAISEKDIDPEVDKMYAPETVDVIREIYRNVGFFLVGLAFLYFFLKELANSL